MRRQRITHRGHVAVREIAHPNLSAEVTAAEVTPIPCTQSDPLVDEEIEEISTTLNLTCRNIDLSEELAAIAIRHNLTRAAVNDFSKLLISLGHVVPKDARTILKTPRKKIKSKTFVHLGLIKNLIRKLKSGLKDSGLEFELQINIDGTPLFNSSSVQLWPILGRISNGVDSTVFVISLYCGFGKPPDVRKFLKTFVKELVKVEEHGVHVNGRRYKIKSTCFICDAPARQYVKGTQCHSGYNSCERCTVIGESCGSNGRRIFISMSKPPRTDAGFRKQIYVNHQLVGKKSILFRSKIDVIRSFVIDYMHCVCLGTVKRFLLILKDEVLLPEDKVHILTSHQKDIFDKLMGELKDFLPFEFNRKGRLLSDLCRWKAVEFRLILLYTGLVVFRSVLSEEKYKNYLKLYVAMRFLLSPSPSNDQIEYANQLLRKYVYDFANLFGKHHLVFNFHCLIHIAADCSFFQTSLNNISCFPFESFLGKIKKLVRGSQNPLSQITRRICEIEHVEDNSSNALVKKNNILDSLRGNTKANSFIMLKDKSIYKLTNINPITNTAFAMPLTYSTNDNLFTSPVPATNLDIYVCDKENDATAVLISENDLLSCIKCVGLPLSADKMLLMPLLHLL